MWIPASTPAHRQGITFLAYFYRNTTAPTTGAVVRHPVLGLRAFVWRDGEHWVDVTEDKHEFIGYLNIPMARERVELIDALES